MAGRFGAVLTAMVTPFRDDRSLDVERAQEVARWLLDHGSDGLVVAGTTGESPTLSDQEKTDLWRAVVEAVEGRGPVIAGSGTYDTAHSVHLTQEAEKAGCDAALVVSPYYNKPPQEGLYQHFATVARETALPVILYNVPGRTSVRIDQATILRLAEIENIVAVKDATGDVAGAADLVAQAPSGFEVISGDDALTFAHTCVGATGVISVASHVVGERMGRMLELVRSGDVSAARSINQELGPVYDALFMTTSPIPVKAAMGLVGQPVGPPRLPLVPATDEQRERLRKALADAGAL